MFVGEDINSSSLIDNVIIQWNADNFKAFVGISIQLSKFTSAPKKGSPIFLCWLAENEIIMNFRPDLYQ